jgi:hypothetical protein
VVILALLLGGTTHGAILVERQLTGIPECLLFDAASLSHILEIDVIEASGRVIILVARDVYLGALAILSLAQKDVHHTHGLAPSLSHQQRSQGPHPDAVGFILGRDHDGVLAAVRTHRLLATRPGDLALGH